MRLVSKRVGGKEDATKLFLCSNIQRVPSVPYGWTKAFFVCVDVRKSDKLSEIGRTETERIDRNRKKVS